MLLNESREESFFSITDCSGRQVSLLNNNHNNTDSYADMSTEEERSRNGFTTVTEDRRTKCNDPMMDSLPIMNNQWHQQPNVVTNNNNNNMSQQTTTTTAVVAFATASNNNNNKSSKRRHQCSECHKSFTTSGHLARHNRIHTGEKNFPCLFPGCQSRFSRQDNMMQHYRTHMSPRSRRSHNKRSTPANNNSSVTGPYTRVNNVGDDRPKPRLHAHHRIRSDPFHVERPLTIDQHLSNYHRTNQQRSTLPSIHHMITSPSSITMTTSSITGTTTTTTREGPTTTTTTFYQHRPLTFSKNLKNTNSSISTTLLNPSSSCTSFIQRRRRDSDNHSMQSKEDALKSHGNHSTAGSSSSPSSSPSSESLSQFTNIVSTFG